MIFVIDKLLKDIGKKQGLKVYISEAPKVEECIVYTYEPGTNNGCRTEDYVEVRLIIKDLNKYQALTNLISEGLLRPGDDTPVDDIISIEQTTGGSMKVGEYTHVFMGYQIIY